MYLLLISRINSLELNFHHTMFLILDIHTYIRYVKRGITCEYVRT